MTNDDDDDDDLEGAFNFMENLKMKTLGLFETS